MPKANLRFDGTRVDWIIRDIPKRLDFDRSVLGTQPIVRLARRCPPHRRRLHRHLGQLGMLFQHVTDAIKIKSLMTTPSLALKLRMIRACKNKM